MVLKTTIDKEAFDKLSKDIQAEYTKKGADEYILDVDADDDDDPENDPGELRRARDREKADAKEAKKKLKEAEKKLADLEGGRTDKDKDITKLESEWKERLEAAQAERDEKLTKANKVISDQMINSAADRLATEISTKPKWLARDIRDRLTVEFDEESGEPELIVKNSKGKNSDMTLEQLRKEIVANKEYADILIGSKASGGGAPRKGADQKPGGTGASEDAKPPMLSRMSGKDLAEHIKAKKEAETNA